MGTKKVSWLERLCTRVFPKQSDLLSHVLGDPYRPALGAAEMGAFLGLRLAVVLPLVTIPTYLHLVDKLPHSHAPTAAHVGFWAWTSCAIAYALVLVPAVVLHWRGALSRSIAVLFSCVCLFIEVSLSTLYAYLIGVSGGALQVLGTMAFIIMVYRLFLYYRFGLISYFLACSVCGFLVLGRHFGLPAAPIHPSPTEGFVFGIGDFVFALGWCTVVFIGCNLGTNQVHKLKSQLEVAHEKLAELNQFITEGVLKRYLPPALIQQIVAGEVSMDKPAEMKTLTILFSDLKGFTETSEKLGPQEIGNILNDYFSAMNEVIFEHGGTIDKFIGDAIMVFFGAPKSLDPKTQAEQAAACGLAMQHKMRELSRLWADKGAQHLDMRIGVHQGQAVVGNFGSKERMDYTCIGPSVNLASRIESVCEPGEVFISQPVAILLNHGAYEEVGSFSLKGITDEQTLFRCLAERS